MGISKKTCSYENERKKADEQLKVKRGDGDEVTHSVAILHTRRADDLLKIVSNRIKGIKRYRSSNGSLELFLLRVSFFFKLLCN